MENSYNTKQGELILSLLRSEEGKHFTADEITKVFRNAQKAALAAIKDNKEDCPYSPDKKHVFGKYFYLETF